MKEKRDWQRTNLLLSGWSGAGTSTTALCLALAFHRRYLYLGGLFRYLSQRLGYQSEGQDRLSADEYLEEYLGKILDQLFSDVLKKEHNLVAESDIGGFLIQRWWSTAELSKIYRIFLQVDQSTRTLRAQDDGRSNAQQILRQRDVFHQQKYQQLWQIDVFDLSQIVASYDYVLDTSQVSLTETVMQIGRHLRDWMSDFPPHWQQLLTEAVQVYKVGGKEKLRQALREQDLIISPQLMLQYLGKDFVDQIGHLPLRLRQVLGLGD